MTDGADNLEREETISDLELPEGEAELAKGGFAKVKFSDLPVTKPFDKSSP